MKKVYLMWNNDFNDYKVSDSFRNNNKELYFLLMAIEPFEDTWIETDIIPEKNKICIYSLESTKHRINVDFNKPEAEVHRLHYAYHDYFMKRWEEIPKVVLTISDWEALQEQWKQILKDRPPYVILTLEHIDAFDKVEIIGKNELSEQDIKDIKKEHEKFLRYEKAHEAYVLNHPDYSENWRDPQDNEFEADIMKYYDDKA